MAEIGYRTPQAVRLAGCTYRQADFWARIGLVAPSITEAHGSGSARRYSALDVVCMRVVAAVGFMGAGRRGGGVAIDTPQVRDGLALIRQAVPFGAGELPVLVLSARDARLFDAAHPMPSVAASREPLLLVPVWPLGDGLSE